jgi:hypothetical protein
VSNTCPLLAGRAKSKGHLWFDFFLYSLLLFHSGGLSGVQVPQIALRYVRDSLVVNMPSRSIYKRETCDNVVKSRKSWNPRIQGGTRSWAEIGGLRGGQLQPTDDFAAGLAHGHPEQGNAGADHLCSSSKCDTVLCCVHAEMNPDLFSPLHAAVLRIPWGLPCLIICL